MQKIKSWRSYFDSDNISLTKKPLKKLEFYLATGNLPPSATKFSVFAYGNRDLKQSGASKPLKDSNSVTQTSSENTDTYEDGRDYLNSSSGRIGVNEYTCSPAAVEYKPKLPNPGPISEKGAYVQRKEENGFGTPKHGNLCYKSPLEFYSPSEVDLQRMYGYESGGIPGAASPVRLSTPPCNRDMGLGGRRSPESFLREAARTFANTPSIFRKRRKIDDEVNVSEVSPGLLVERDDEMNVSPPYRIRGKRRAVLKSRQLDFISVKERQQPDDETEKSELASEEDNNLV